jgi:hypothetical protein
MMKIRCVYMNAKQISVMLFLVLACAIFSSSSIASDHADPIFNKKKDAGIAGLFVFPDDENMVFILNVYPGLTSNPPYKLEQYLYRIHVDLHTNITFDNLGEKIRYGGSIEKPSEINADVTIDFKLKNDAELYQIDIKGIENSGDIKTWSGVRDDPFIFPKFFGTNVISMVASIPKSLFPVNQETFVVWASSHKANNMKKIDHVGRSNRTMQPRLNFLNKLHPSEHKQAIQKRHDDPGFFQKILMQKLQPLFAVRHYDIFPDVMIYSNQFPAGFPNGRKLTDDVADLTCQGGDCLLWELSFADGVDWPRQVVNDKPFLDEFPFLAEPWPAEN